MQVGSPRAVLPTTTSPQQHSALGQVHGLETIRANRDYAAQALFDGAVPGCQNVIQWFNP
jgi:hypothetical protein